MGWIIKIHLYQPNSTLGEMVQVTSLRNATRWKTYALPAPEGSGKICLNGPPAHLFQASDLIIILSLGLLYEDEITALQSKIVFVDGLNQITRVETHQVNDMMA
jgi:aspartate 1-decarboxylase